MTARKVIVTGASGFVGRALVSHLSAEGWQVVGTDVRQPDAISSVHGFLRADLAKLLPSLDVWRGTDTVVHSMVDINNRYSRLQIKQRNHDVLVGLLAACRSAGVRHFILISTSSIFPPDIKQGAPEARLGAPRDAYGSVRYQMEVAVDAANTQEFSTSILRPHIIIGPRRAGIFEATMQRLRSGYTLYLPASVRGYHQVVHIEDIARATSLVLAKGLTGSFNVGPQPNNTLLHYIGAFIQMSSSRSRVKIIPDTVLRPAAWLSDHLKLNFFGPNRPLVNSSGFRLKADKLAAIAQFRYSFSEERAWEDLFVSLLREYKL